MYLPKNSTAFIAISVIVFLISISPAGSISADTLESHVIGGGGGQMESGRYALQSSVGQAFVGSVETTAVDLCSGFWCTIDSSAYFPWPLFLPAITGEGR